MAVPAGFEPVIHSPALIELCRQVNAWCDGRPYFFGGDFEWRVYSDGTYFIAWEDGKGNLDGTVAFLATELVAIERTLAWFLSSRARGMEGLPPIVVPYWKTTTRMGYQVRRGGFPWKDREPGIESVLNPLPRLREGWWTVSRPDGSMCPVGFDSGSAADQYTLLDPFSVEAIIRSILSPDGAPAFTEFVRAESQPVGISRNLTMGLRTQLHPSTTYDPDRSLLGRARRWKGRWQRRA